MRIKDAELKRRDLQELNEKFVGTYKFTRRNVDDLDAMYIEFYGISFSYAVKHNICVYCEEKMTVDHYTYVCKKCFLEMLSRIKNGERRERFMAKFVEYID